MNNHTQHKPFVFNHKIDQDLLHSLYEDDFGYMEEIFSITLSQLKPDFEKLEEAFSAEDTAAVQKLVHKMKPSFGFVGLPGSQELCKRFEDLCANSSGLTAIKHDYQTLYNNISDSISLLESEYARLKEFNKA